MEIGLSGKYVVQKEERPALPVVLLTRQPDILSLRPDRPSLRNWLARHICIRWMRPRLEAPNQHDFIGSSPVSLSSGVARICCEEGQSWKLCHGALTADSRAGCSNGLMTNSFVTNAVLIERAVSCWHLHQLISQTTQYLDSWLSDLLQSELKMKLLEVEGARAPVPHSWRRHCP